MKIDFIKICFIFSCLLSVSCGGSSSGGGDADSGSDSSGLMTACGVVLNNTLFNPIRESRGIEVTLVNVLDSNALTLSDGNREFIVKLHGIGGTTGFRNTAARGLFNSLAAEKLYFFSAGNCDAGVIGGRIGMIGSVVTESGISFSEEVVRRKFAGVIEETGGCGEQSVSACLTSIARQNRVRAFGPSIPCTTMPSHTRYNPSDSACNGNASVTVDNSVFGNVFSIQLRYPDGTDRIIQECADSDCTPLKVQRYIRGNGRTVGCFGTPGSAVALNDINHTSVKREGTDSTPPRYCIPNPAVSVN